MRTETCGRVCVGRTPWAWICPRMARRGWPCSWMGSFSPFVWDFYQGPYLLFENIGFNWQKKRRKDNFITKKMYPPSQPYLNPHQYHQKKQDRVKSDKSWSLLLNSNREFNKNDFPPYNFTNNQTYMSEEDQFLQQPLRQNIRATSIELKSKNSKPKTPLAEKKKTKKICNQNSGRTTEPTSKKKSIFRRYFGLRENSVL
jgi:hypothetical protein